MVDIKQTADKLKKIAAGVTLMAGIAMGTGCDGSQQIHRVPSEDVVNDDDEKGDNNETINDGFTENNDGDKPIDNNDQNNPIEHNDSDAPIDNNDGDGITDVNDNDPIEHNDEDDTEINDNDTPQSDECAPEDIIIKSENIANLSQDEIQGRIDDMHNQNRGHCYGALTEKEKVDTNGNLCIEDECDIGPNDIATAGGGVWIDNLPFLAKDPSYTLPPPGGIVYYGKVEQLNKSGPTDLIRKQRCLTFYIKDVPTVSCFAPNNVVDDASTITMVATAEADKGCYMDGQSISPSDIIATKNIQPKINSGEFREICEKVPNSTYVPSRDKCRTTVTEFAWLENVSSYLNNKSGTNWNKDLALINTKTEYDLDNNVFRMYFSSGALSWVVELPNAKRCLDECYGIDGCEVSIKPSPDVSKGCIVNGKESAQNLKMQKHNLKHKQQAAPVVAKQNYLKAIRPNRKKWLAQNMRNFGRNGR